MNKERGYISEKLRQGGTLVAVVGAVIGNAPAIAFGILGYFTGDYLYKPKQA